MDASAGFQAMGRADERSVVIVDPSAMARAGLRAALVGAGLRVMGEYATCDGVQAADVSPDVVIVGPGHGVAPQLERLRATLPDARLLVLAGGDTDVAAAVQAGADGILPAAADGDAILPAIEDLCAGRAVLDPALAFRALRARGEPIPDPDPLTPRELEVLRLMSQGNTNPQIASRLLLAVGTVKVHVEHILSKLGATDRTDAAVRALSRGLLDDKRG